MCHFEYLCPLCIEQIRGCHFKEFSQLKLMIIVWFGLWFFYVFYLSPHLCAHVCKGEGGGGGGGGRIIKLC